MLRALGCVLIGLVLVTSACTSDDDQPEERDTTATPSPPALADVDTASVVVARVPFCDRITTEAVTTALGGEPSAPVTWASGDRVPVGDSDDVVHEFGCSWESGDGSGGGVSAWVFAPPVTAERAAALRTAAVKGRGCTEVTDTASFGEPGVTTRCVRPDGTFVGFRGLFGDAWLDCRVTAPEDADARSPELVGRAADWCAAVLYAAQAPA